MGDFRSKDKENWNTSKIDVQIISFSSSGMNAPLKLDLP